MFSFSFFFFFLSPCLQLQTFFLTGLFFLLQKIGLILLAISQGRQRLVRIIIAGGVGVGLRSLKLKIRRQIRNSSLESER